MFAASGIALEKLARARLEGTRRAGRILVEELSIEPLEGALSVSFRLPKGSYATVVLREITKDGGALDEEADD